MAPRTVTNLTDLARLMREQMKDKTNQASMGHSAEYEFFEGLDKGGADVLISPEQGAVDGAFRKRFGPAPYAANAHPGHAWREALSEPSERPHNVHFLTFDIKYYSLLPTGRKGEDYAFLNPPWARHSKNAEVYVLMFERVPDYVAIVPQGVWEGASDLSHGLEALINDVPAWCYLFMVHFSQLGEAVDSLFAAAAATTEGARPDLPFYQNPTTTVILKGWRPRYTEQPQSIWPESEAFSTSLDQIMRFWDALEELGVICRANPIQPFFCDFLLPDPATGRYLRIEHKCFQGEAHFPVDLASPFSGGRQWHFLIAQESESLRIMSRHEVQAGWSDATRWPTSLQSRLSPYNREGLQDVLQFISQNATSAVACADAVAASSPPEGFDLVVLASSNSRRVRILTKSEQDELRGKATRVFHDRGLPGLTLQLHEWCCRRRRLAVLPVDLTHCVGDKAVVDVEWSDDDVTKHRRGEPPFRLFEKGMHSKTCSMLRSMDMSIGRRANDTFPLHMREAYWTRLPINQVRPLLHGSTAKSGKPFCMLMPSGFTTMNSHEGRKPEEYNDDDGHQRQSASKARDRARRFWRNEETQKENAVPNISWASGTTETKRFGQGSDFMVDGAVNPVRYIFDLEGGDIHENLVKIMQAAAMTSFDNPQSREPGRAFDAREYRTTVAEILQAMWDFGLTRRPANLKKLEKEKEKAKESEGAIAAGRG